MMDQIPERRLSDQARARRRHDLLAAIDDAPATDGRRRRWLAPAAAAAAVAVVGGAVYLAGGTGGAGGDAPTGPDRSIGFAGSSEPGVDPTSAGDQRPPPEDDGCAEVTSADDSWAGDGAPWNEPPTGDALASYRDLLAEHLDPDGDHLDRRISNVQSGGGACAPDHLGTRLGWREDGRPGLGMVQVEVGHGAKGSSVLLAHDGWDTVSTQGDLPGVRSARVVEYDGGMAVLVTREDGVSVGIDANTLFGNNSDVAIPGFPFTVDDLLAAAADPDFALP